MQPQKRTCLKCGDQFDSMGPANRICPACQKINARLPAFGAAELKKQRGGTWRNGERIE